MNNKFQKENDPTIYGMALAFYNEWKKKPYTLTFKQIETLCYISKEIGYPVRDKKCGICLKSSCEIVEKYVNNYIENQYDKNLISTNDLYLDKSVLIVGNGKLSKKLHIEKKKYDIIVGLNEIYKSPSYKYIHIHYFDVIDYEFLKNYNEIITKQCIIFKKYDPEIRNYLNDERFFYLNDNTELSNVWFIEDILKANPKKLEITAHEVDEIAMSYLINSYPNFAYRA
jgi:hypothetical protein